MPFLKTWIKATRPWSLTAAFIPVTLGAILAAYHNTFDVGIYILTAIGGCLLQLGTNMCNTYGDFMSGVDTKESTATCPELTHEVLNPKSVLRLGLLFFTLVALLGVYFVWLRGWPILVMGFIGISLGYGYTMGVAYKYKGLGLPFVFILMGPLMTWSSYYMQTGVGSWKAIWVSMPIACLVTVIMHGNDFRDIASDQKAGIKTMAILLGINGSRKLECALVVVPFLLLGVLTLTQIIPWLALLPLLLLPSLKNILDNTLAVRADEMTGTVLLEMMGAKMHANFGMMMIVGIGIGLFFK